MGEAGDRRSYYREVLSDIASATPELLSVVRRAIELEESGRGEWTVLDVRAPPRKLRILVDYQIVKKTGQFTYKLVDRDALKAAMMDIGALARKKRGPAFDVSIDVFDGIVGYENVKRTIVMALRARGPVHVLLIGPPGVGKSLFLDTVREYLEKRGDCVAHVEGGKSLTTAMGIVEVVLQFPPDTPCLLTIDELDKMPRSEMSVLYRLMTTGEVVLAKHRTIVREKRLVWVLAATNRESAIPPPVLSRFLRIRFRGLTEEEYKAVVPGILVKREGVEEDLARYIAEKLAPVTRDPRDAIKIARMAWTREDVDWLVSQLYGSRSSRLEGAARGQA